MNLDLGRVFATRWFRTAIWAAVCALSIVKFLFLNADFPNYSPWMIDQAKFTDEGWWGSAAVMHFVTGHWYVAGDYNPGVALPVWPLLLFTVFHFIGVSVVAARALNVVISIATLGAVFALVRRYTSMRAEVPALIAVLLLSASPFAFAFSRLAILDTLVVFEFCLLLLVASYASEGRMWPLMILAILTTAMILTKTTAALLIPAVFWVTWSAMARKAPGFLWAILAVGVVPATLLKGYAALAAAEGYGADYKYFFDVNAMPDIEWRQTFATLSELMQNCFWIDRVLYPVGLLILVLTVAWKRKLWNNPLFTASWMAIAAQAVFIFSRQDDYAPRYFLVMLVPLVCIVVLVFCELMIHAPKPAIVLLVAMIGAVVANVVMIGQFLTHRDYDFQNAANSIRNIIRSHPEHKALMLGVSGAQISMMTGISSINDGFGTEDISEKVARYQPGWYLAWSDTPPEKQSFLSAFQLEKVASYPAFDDDDRGALTIYKMVPMANGDSNAHVGKQ
jgi:4-amino-4-deoxy-L-arabinose transferase-like glycosyltransferase